MAGFLALPRLLTVLGCFCTAWPAAAGAACWLLRKILLVPLPAPALPLALSVLFLTMLCWGADATNDVSREAPGEMPTDAADQAPMYAKEGSNVQWKLVDPLEMVDIMVSLDLCALNISSQVSDLGHGRSLYINVYCHQINMLPWGHVIILLAVSRVAP